MFDLLLKPHDLLALKPKQQLYFLQRKHGIYI